MFPDFIIMGAMKAGTSSLYHYLSLHPEVGMSEIKEVDYFVAENNFDKGTEWYESQFRGNFKKYGEASPNYSKAHRFPGVPCRMHELLPGVRLIYLVRDPVERLVSHYTHNYSEGREQRSITDVLMSCAWDVNPYVLCSMYNWQLQHYLEYFSMNQILIVPSYRLKHERKKTLQKIFDFLEVDCSYYTSEFNHQRHQTNSKRRKGRLSWFVLERPVIKTLKNYIPDTVKEPVKKMTRPVVKKPELSLVLRERLRDHFRPEVEALKKLSGESFSCWKI